MGPVRIRPADVRRPDFRVTTPVDHRQGDRRTMPRRRRGTRAVMAVTFAGLVLTPAGWLLSSPAEAQTASPPSAGSGPAATPLIFPAAGNGLLGFSGDGGPSDKAALNTPTGLAVDLTGALWFADTGNNRIRRVTSSTTGTINTVAGTGAYGFGGDGGPPRAATLAAPTAVAVDRF